MDKRTFLKGASAVALAGFLAPAFRARAAGTKRLNVLFLVADDLDVSQTGFMGGKPGLMPNVEALTARSHRFVNGRSVVPICQPSREAMLSGKLPHKSGATGFNPMNQGTVTLPAILQQAGYFAAAIHKIEHMLPQTSFIWDYAQGAPVFARASQNRNPALYESGVELAIAEAKSTDRPFFIACNVNDPHRPFYGSPGGLKLDHQNEGPYKVEKPLAPEDVTVPASLDDLPKVREEVAQYWNSAQRLDISIGRVMKILEKSGEADNTVIFFFSDNGMPFPFGKSTVYDHGTRCPFTIWWPGMGEGRSIDTVSTHLDIMPTLLDLLEIKAPADLAGTSLLPVMRDGKALDRDYVVTYVNQLAGGTNYPQRAIQDKRYAYIFSPWSDGKLAFKTESMRGLTWNAMVEAAKTDPKVAERVHLYQYGQLEALYDIVADPGQRVNLIKNRKLAPTASKMKAALRAYMEKNGDPEIANFDRMQRGEPVIVPQSAATGAAVE
ncbi:sulfatase [Sphingomonas sp. AR_OL41]|uniref:sulfatase family protein n=1 Tax=Sphingomonas sp. AR_OL41 TaxID=3042729 RepID=UPI00247FAE47|nr:sulfatase [Sphingomonas sp. AR_OL41]MDH7975326.1 sulfatase [Sphingomonas sp. AR_OL41]